MTQAIQTAPLGRYRVRHVAKSEIVKMITLPSTVMTLGLTIVLDLLVTGLVTNAALSHRDAFFPGFDATQHSLTGMIVVALTGGVFGALLITGEYASGTIRPTLAATPRRPVLLAGKIAVAATATVAFCEALSFVSFWLGQAILSGGGARAASLGTAGALRAVYMTGLFVALMALMSFGFGLICRSTAAAIATFVGVVFVLPLIMRGISEPDVRYLPTEILTNSVMTTVNQGPGGIIRPLSPGPGLLLMAGYAAITLVIGAVLFIRRDA